MTMYYNMDHYVRSDAAHGRFSSRLSSSMHGLLVWSFKHFVLFLPDHQKPMHMVTRNEDSKRPHLCVHLHATAIQAQFLAVQALRSIKIPVDLCCAMLMMFDVLFGGRCFFRNGTAVLS